MSLRSGPHAGRGFPGLVLIVTGSPLICTSWPPSVSRQERIGTLLVVVSCSRSCQMPGCLSVRRGVSAQQGRRSCTLVDKWWSGSYYPLLLPVPGLLLSDPRKEGGPPELPSVASLEVKNIRSGWLLLVRGMWQALTLYGSSSAKAPTFQSPLSSSPALFLGFTVVISIEEERERDPCSLVQTRSHKFLIWVWDSSLEHNSLIDCSEYEIDATCKALSSLPSMK